MTFEDLKQAAMVFNRINSIRSYVSKERFAMVASTNFCIDDERKIDMMYGLLNLTPRLVYYIANYDDKEVREIRQIPEYMMLMPKAIEIAESAYSLNPMEYSENHVPTVECGDYRKKDVRRYFYEEYDEKKTLDVDLCSRSDIVLLSGVLQRGGVIFRGVAEHLGFLEGKANNGTKEKFQYFDGDIYFLYGDVTDKIFYDWFSNGEDAGVYVATKIGWRKLLYTPGRGYIDKGGDVDYVDDYHFYSNYMLERSGMGFQYVGNIYYDTSVLKEKSKR